MVEEQKALESKKTDFQEENDTGLPDLAQKDNAQKLYRIGGVLLLVIIAIVAIYSLMPSSSNDKNTDVKTTDEYTVTGQKVIGSAKTTVVMNQTKPSAEELDLIQKKQRALQERLSAPMLVVSGKGQSGGNVTTETTPASSDPNTRFMEQVSAKNTETVTATVMGDLGYLVAEGSLIHGVLETAVNSDLPGYLRAIVTKPIYSENGSRVLIPDGSRLIGQYKSGLLQGQSRIFVVWTRLILPSGISVKIASEGTDNLGVAGMGADSINRHFWARFGNAILLSIIGAGAENVGVSSGDQYNATQAYRVAVASSLANSANQSLQQSGMIAPTLRVNQGKPIIVFVAHDLDFKNAMQTVKPKFNVF